jgi:hypothetical protein
LNPCLLNVAGTVCIVCINESEVAEHTISLIR